MLSLLPITLQTARAEVMELSTEEMLMAVVINQKPQGVVFILRRNDRLFVEAKDLRSWRLRLPDNTALSHYGVDFFALDALEGLSYKFDAPNQTLEVQVPPSLFDETLLNGVIIDHPI